jgi:glycosyltransferase involved in cell wall biosynthesis
MKIAALTSGLNIPSARFRVRQYLPYLRESGLDVVEYCPKVSQGARLPGVLGEIRARYFPPLLIGQAMTNLAYRVPGLLASYKADVTWLERNFVPGLDDLASLIGSPIVLDIDDAIWLYNPLGISMIRRLVKRADMVFAGNQFLANWCGEFCQTVRIVPTAIDAGRFVPRAQPKSAGSPFVIGWTGTSGNFKFLSMIEPALAEFLHATPSARFLIIADRRPSLPKLPANQVDFHQWSSQDEHLMLHEMDIGIMPLDDTELSRGKCSFKMLQYMAAGLPVIVSPVGMNAEVLALGAGGFGAKSIPEWVDCLKFYFENPSAVSSHGAQSRSLVLDRFDLSVIGKGMAKSFSDLLGS